MYKLFFLVIFTALFFTCSREISGPEEQVIEKLGRLDVQYTIKKVDEITSTRQTVLWLEDEHGNFVKSLFVSDWLAWGGYSHNFVCPTWNQKTNWPNISEEEFDAVTGPTPRAGEHQVSIDLSQIDIEPGVFICNIETHIENNYNIRYSVGMPLKGNAVSATPSPTYIPELHPQAGDLLYDVLFDYNFTNQE